MAEPDPEAIHIPVSADDSNDSAFGDDISDTTSVASTIWRHRYENGRRYHKFREGAYWGPNDDAQNDQLDIGHHMLRLLIDDKLFLAPIEKPQKVLDIGCGTGIWSIDFADEFPDCEVIGTDLSPIQPQFCPPNCHFEIDDCTEPWTFPKNSFDMIHVRCLFGSVGDWPAFYREALDHLRPGGWINQMEMAIQFKADDGTCPPDHTMAEWSKLFIETADKFGKTMKVADNMKTWITDAGFEDVNEVRFKLPVGPWSSDPKMKELGKWNLLYCYHGCEGWAMFLLTHVLKWKYEEVMVLVAKFKEALRDRKTHAYYDVSVVYGRKPSAP
ncbi:Sam dependent methyltransferase [Lasiodiplodia theobromae]|uniref:Sam dependent methyltransferase n=1 Tax=Lasiodiplodia theobromae TaxID=45133 RepID=UPI0015C3C5A5|nr:Sam dependent methyltransferase [Lasiodiplodia theobromae]KAF4543068.1 Sam dependent methyltransferase [Lasiodiplodia theobromae]